MRSRYYSSRSAGCQKAHANRFRSGTEGGLTWARGPKEAGEKENQTIITTGTKPPVGAADLSTRECESSPAVATEIVNMIDNAS